jgi:hypothetical protein
MGWALLRPGFSFIMLALACFALSPVAQARPNPTLAPSKNEFLLVQAGFKPKTVTTPKQQQQVSQLAVDRVSSVKYQGKVYYVFPTAQKDHILVGTQAQFNAYKALLRIRLAAPL